jgi:hypothetical protein
MAASPEAIELSIALVRGAAGEPSSRRCSRLVAPHALHGVGPASRTANYSRVIMPVPVSLVNVPPERVSLGCPLCGRAVVVFLRMQWVANYDDGPRRPWPKWRYRIDTAKSSVSATGKEWTANWSAKRSTKPGDDRFRVRCPDGVRCGWPGVVFRADTLEALAIETGSHGRRRARLPVAL